MTGRQLIPALIICGFALAVPVSRSVIADADDRLPEYYEGLRARRMFAVAEGDALRRLAHRKLTPAQRADLAVELSRTYAAHAAYSTGDQREELWERSAAIVDQLLRSEPTSPFRVLLLTQRAMVPAARGAQLRWQGELFPLDDATRKQAESALRDALEQLRPLPSAIEQELRTVLSTPRRDEDDSHEPAPSRLHQLSRRVEYAMAAAALDLARILPPGADQVAALLDADARFESLLRIARPDAIAWQARVHRLDIMRLRGQRERLAGHVNALIKGGPPLDVADSAAAVLVRSWLDDDRPDDALATLEEHRRDYGLDAEELQALVVESLLAARRIALQKSDETLAADLLKRAEAIDARLLGPWRVRTRLLLQQASEEDRYGPELAKSVREAQWAWQNGDGDTAIAAYGRAASQAHQQGQRELAVEFALNAASAQVETGQFDAAANSLSELLRAYPKHDKAAEADLLRAYALGRLYQQQLSDERKTAYRDALQAHRTSFAGQPTAAEATWMLARLAEHDQNWDRALELLASLPQTSPHKPSAIVRTAAIFENVIEAARERGEPTAEWERRAAETLSKAVEAFPDAPSRLTVDQAETAWRLARMLLHRAPPDFGLADRLLERIINNGQAIERDDTAVDGRWQPLVAQASQLRIISLAGQGRLAEARAMLEQVAAAEPGKMLDILNGLTEVAADIGIEHRTGIGRMQLELAQQVKSQLTSLPDDQQRSLDVALAQAHAAIGQWQEAARIYEALLWKQPKDRQIVRALATLYEECGSASCLHEAIKQWLRLEPLQRKGSTDWLQTRYHMASCSHRLGDEETARKLIGVTQLLYPDLGTPSLKARYEALAADVAAASR